MITFTAVLGPNPALTHEQPVLPPIPPYRKHKPRAAALYSQKGHFPACPTTWKA